MKRRDDLREFLGLKDNDTFKKYLDKIKHKPHVQWEQQYKFVLDTRGELMVDYLGKFETIIQDAQEIFDYLNISTSLILIVISINKAHP